MLRRFAFLVAAVAALTVNAVFAGSSWPQSGYDARGTNFNGTEKTLSARNVRSLHVAWSIPGVTAPVASGQAVYGVMYGSNAGAFPGVVVINARTGATTHFFSSRQLGLQTKPADAPQALALWNGRLIVGARGQVLALNPSTGKIYWRVPGGADALVISGKQLFTGKGCQSACGSLVSQSIDLSTGKLLWTHRGNFGHAPVLMGSHLYQVWGEYGGHTSVYDQTSGTLLGTMPIYGEWTGSAGHTYAYVVSARSIPNKHAALKEIGPDGRAQWSINLGRAGDGYLVYAYGTIFTGSYRFSPGMVAINAANGRIRWAADLGQYLHLAAANHLLIATNDQTGQVSVLNAGSGRILRQLTLPNKPYAVSSLAIAGGTIYVSDASGLTAIRP